MWRCENVPRSVSWPVSRTGMPSTSKRRERERLGVSPVDPARVERLPALEQLLDELRVDREVVGHGEQLVVERAQLVAATAVTTVGAAAARDPAVALLRRPPDRLAQPRELAQLVLGARDDRLDVRFGDDALLDQPPRELLARGRMLFDLLRHQRLRVRRLVLLVVPYRR